MIDDLEKRRPTRAEQRVATRSAITDAAIDCLVEDGYVALTTRRVAERAGIAQSTVMHHFDTREALLVDAVERVALTLADGILDRVDLAALRAPEQRAAVLDEAWSEFVSPRALAAAQLWAAVFSEPELAPTLRQLEERLGAIILATTGALFPEHADDPRLPALLDGAVSMIRGLVMGVPVWGTDVITARWEHVKPLLLHAAEDLLDG